MYWIALVATDLLVYLVLSISLMGYDDNYDLSKGEYGSLGSMKTIEKIFYLLFILWNVFNVVLIFWIGFRIYKQVKLKP